MERIELKTLLLEIKNNDYKVPESNAAIKLGYEMLNHIGDLDPVLRDELIYEVLENWVLNDIFSNEEIKELLQIAFDDHHLYLDLGSVEGDSIFTRTFSLLFIAVVIYRHQKNIILTKNEVIHYLKRTLSYLDAEQDVRGFVENKGWAHSVAHCADVLAQFAGCEELDKRHHHSILNVFFKKIVHQQYTYMDQEDERITTAVVRLIKRNTLTHEELINWINRLVSEGALNTFPDDLKRHLNVKHFLRSLYFRLIDDNEHHNLLEILKDGLNSINRFK